MYFLRLSTLIYLKFSFGDNDFLSAQVAILLEGGCWSLLTDTPGLHTSDPRTSAGAELVEEVGLVR